MSGPQFLPGIPASHVLARLAMAGGKEVESGKLLSPESSATLAVNCFGWFIERPEKLPSLKGIETAGVPELVDVEFCARFPWSGGRHPWLDAVVQTPTTLIGIESKRFEPFRDVKSVSLSDAYDRPVWGANMKGYERIRDCLRSGEERFIHLDGIQEVSGSTPLSSTMRAFSKPLKALTIFGQELARAYQPYEARGALGTAGVPLAVCHRLAFRCVPRGFNPVSRGSLGCRLISGRGGVRLRSDRTPDLRDAGGSRGGPTMARSSTLNVEQAKRVYSDLVRAVLDLAAECPESHHVDALATVVDAFHDDVLRPLEGGRPDHR